MPVLRCKKPMLELTVEAFRGYAIEGVFTDIDDTLTTEGAITADALEALARLRSAGIPVVPIVIRNAEVIAARDSSTFHAGKVDVVVFPPISVEDWTLDNLSERIDEVRQLYLDTLRKWPHDKVPDNALCHRAAPEPADTDDSPDDSGEAPRGAKGRR